MSTKNYVDAQGNFLGVFVDYPGIPEGATEVPTAPLDGRQVLDGAFWRYPKAILHDLAADKRFSVETSGTLLWGVVPVKTDRESQSLINGAYTTVVRSPATVIKWKTEDGFAALDATAITALADVVSAHVQAAFAAESQVVTLIDNNTITTKEALDMWPGWNI